MIFLFFKIDNGLHLFVAVIRMTNGYGIGRASPFIGQHGLHPAHGYALTAVILIQIEQRADGIVGHNHLFAG